MAVTTKDSSKTTNSGLSVTARDSVTKVKKYVREVRSEMLKVTWPTRTEVIVYTGVVFAAVLLVAVGMGILDSILGWGLKAFVDWKM